MIQVNNKNFPTYDFDTEDSIVSRIAYNMKTKPIYIYKKEDEKHNIIAEDILEIIKKDGETNSDFNLFKNNNQSKFGKDIDFKKDIVYIWIVYNKKLEELADINTIILEDIADRLFQEDYLNSKEEFEKVWKEKDNIKRKLNAEIENHSINVEKYGELFKFFDDIKENNVYTDFITEKFDVLFNINLNYTLIELFNKIIVNKVAPFATFKNYYKILKNFIPSVEWSETSDEYITLKVNTKTGEISEYTDVLLMLTTEKKLECVFSLSIDNDVVSKEIFIDRILSCINLQKIDYKNISENNISGVFYFPNLKFNSYVFSDLVMLDPAISTLISIDEYTKPTKKNGWLYMHYNHINTGHISCSLLSKRENDKNTDKKLFIEGEKYIRIHITKAKNKEAVLIFQKMFSKILSYYNLKYNEIVSIYKKYIPDFGEQKEIQTKSKTKKILSDEVFIKNYSRNCSPARKPTVISKEEKKEYKDYEIMKFPRDENEDNKVKYKSDGVNQNYYICENEEYPFPGLQVNKLSNSDVFPFVPCCFKTDQKDKKGSVYRQYYFDEEVESKVKKQQNLILTDKFLDTNTFGELSQNIKKFFETLDNEVNYKYIRVGVERNHTSFLSCVMFALSEQTDILNYEGEERVKKVLETRKILSKEQFAPGCRQSLYDVDISEIQQNIQNTEHYLEPKLYIQLLESYFSCNIFLFNSESIVSPRFIQSYYRKIQKGPCVFIYEHMGSESDHAKYPQCELIVKWNTTKSKDVKYVFDMKETISKSINNIFLNMNKCYVLNKPLTDIEFNIDKNIISGQVIDSYGKSRQLYVNYKGSEICLLTSPNQPLLVPEFNRNKKLVKGDKNTVMNFIKDYRLKIVSQTVINNTLLEINCKIGNINVSIPVNDSVPLNDLHITVQTHSKENISLLNKFNKNKKLSRYICEYMFWIFSKYVLKNKISNINDTVLRDFAKDSVILNTEHKYKSDVSNRFEENNNNLTKDAKLIVNSEELLLRLMYVLKLYSIRDLNGLLNYHAKIYIEKYYQDITDFDIYDDQVLIEGEDSIYKLIQESNIKNVLHDTVIVNQKTPYFFKNNRVSKKILLAQNAISLKQALLIGNIWNNKHFNKGQYSKETEGPYTFILHSYKNSNNITSYRVKGNETLKDIHILGYKIEEKTFFTVLMDI